MLFTTTLHQNHQKETLSIMLFNTTLYRNPPERDTLNYAVYYDTLSKTTRKRQTQLCCLQWHFIKNHQKETESIMLFTTTLYQNPPEWDTLNYAVYYDTLSKSTRMRHTQLCCLLRHFIKIHQNETHSIMLFTTTLYQKPPKWDRIWYRDRSALLLLVWTNLMYSKLSRIR